MQSCGPVRTRFPDWFCYDRSQYHDERVRVMGLKYHLHASHHGMLKMTGWVSGTPQSFSQSPGVVL